MEPELIDPDSSLEEYLHALHASMGKAGPIIRAACRAAGMSQRELADAIGASRSAVARLEQDGPQTPWSHVVNALRVCGCTLHVRTADGAGLVLPGPARLCPGPGRTPVSRPSAGVAGAPAR